MNRFCIVSLFLFAFNIAAKAQWSGMKVKQVIPTEYRMYNFAVAHTNKDVFPDLVALPVDAFSTVMIYPGNQQEEFSFSSSFSKEENYRVLKKGDLDADGIDDLVISAYWNNGFKIFWGNENGTHTEGQHYGLTGHGKNVELTDLDMDGDLDIVALSGGSGQPITMHLFYGNKTRVLTPGEIYRSVLDTDKRITIVDKDQNGLPDVMVASSFPWFVIFYQHPDGTFKPQYWPYKLELPFTSDYYLADLNNDNKEDIMANYLDEGLRFYQGKSDTLFNDQYTEHKLDFRPIRIFTTDLNKDGFIDLVTDHMNAEGEPTDTLHFFLGNGDFTFQELKPMILPGVVDNFIVENLNNDGYPDIIAYCRERGIVTVVNNGVVTSVEDEEQLAQVFPNPFSNQLQVQLQTYPAVVTIYDGYGILKKKIQATKNVSISTDSWSSGLYIVRVQSGQRLISRKIIKQ